MVFALTSCKPQVNQSKKTIPCIRNCTSPLALEKECLLPDDLTERSYQVLLSNKTYGSCTNICKNSVSIILLKNICVYKTQTKPCLVRPENSIDGYLKSENGGVTFGQCEYFKCNNGYELIENKCLKITTTPAITNRACIPQPLNSTNGQQSSTDNGLNWSTCTGFTCSQGFILTNNSCISTIVTRACTNQPENSSGGLETSLNQGSSWTICADFTCNYGYAKSGTRCNSTTLNRTCKPQPENSTGGTQTSSDNGVTWKPCSDFTCNQDFQKSDNLCKQLTWNKSCDPQPINTSGGYQATVDGGNSFSVCKNFNCLSGFILTNGQCTPNGEVANYNISDYVAKFIKVAKVYNRELTIIPDASLDPTLPSNILGICAYAHVRYIRLNLAWWGSSSTNNAYREYVVFHELGHCVLDRGHDEKTVALADYKTIQTPVSM